MPRRAKKKLHFIYKTTCIINNQFYYGMHSTDDLNDGYKGSGKRLRNSLNKHGEKNHEIEILEFLSDRESLKKREAEIVNELLIQDPLCMNLKTGGEGGLSSKEHAEKFHAAGGKKVFQILSKRHSENLKNDPEYKIKYSKTMSKAISGEKNGFYGKSHSAESIKKMSDADRTGLKNSQFGTRWITNGKTNKKIKATDSLPIGYEFGRALKN